MVYFCADDYGISSESNSRIERCLQSGALNKVSVLPNGEIDSFKQRLQESGARIALHVNLVEGYPLSKVCDIPLIVTDDGCFRYSFVRLLLLSLSSKRKELEKQLYTEISKQVVFWKGQMGDNAPICIDSHQHTHMIPLVFKVLMKVIRDEMVNVECIRIPAEPIAPYILTPSLYSSYSLNGLAKQWLLKIFALINGRELKSSGIDCPCFMGAMFSGKLTEDKIKKLLPHYLKIAKRHDKDIEIAFHPGYSKDDEDLINGYRTSFGKFYFSDWRKKEYDTLMNLDIKTKLTKEENKDALH